jgi:hypothetical protein
VILSVPIQVVVRSYQVGFGDCFLLSFVYNKTAKHVLIDFGSTALPDNTPRNQLARVAQCISKDCDGKLYAVVATHRHADHINGFDPGDNNRGPGSVIASLKPDIVVQPWTEDPNAQEDAGTAGPVNVHSRSFIRALRALDHLPLAVARALTGRQISSSLAEPLAFLAKTNISNRRAVTQLTQMGVAGAARYVHYGSSSGLILPGVRVRVLGPPTIEQFEGIAKQRQRDPDEFWHLLAAGSLDISRGIPFAPRFLAKRPPRSARWIIDRLQYLPAQQLLEIVRVLDGVLNNTSVILLFEVGKQILLFPGDAQIESWMYALAKARPGSRLEQQLSGITVYKVGHHGSLNATPKTLWNMLRFRKTAASRGAGDPIVHTFLSSMSGKHGRVDDNTEVPRRTLVDALRTETVLHTTEALQDSDLRLTQSFGV